MIIHSSKSFPRDHDCTRLLYLYLIVLFSPFVYDLCTLFEREPTNQPIKQANNQTNKNKNDRCSIGLWLPLSKYDPVPDILESCKVLVQIRFTKSKTELGMEHKKCYKRLASTAAKQLLNQVFLGHLIKQEHIRKTSKLHKETS